MDTKDYFLLALAFAIVALLAFLMRNNPLFMATNTDATLAGYTSPTTYNLYVYYTTLTLPIFIMSIYLAIAFAIVGAVNYAIAKTKKRVS